MSNKVPVKEKIGYGCGEFGGSLVWQVIIWFLPIFYTDVVGLSAGFIAVTFAVVRIFDAINDPVMGIIADRTETRWGKFRPYILWMCVPYVVCAVVMFITPGFGQLGKNIYAFATYCLMMVIYTAMMIPYCSLNGVITGDHVERTSLTSYRFIGAFSGSLVMQATMIYLVLKLGTRFGGTGEPNEQVGYPLAMAVFGAVCLIGFFIAFATIRERVKPPKDQQTTVKRDIKDLFNNVPWIILFLVSLLTLVYVCIRSGDASYFFTYYFGPKTFEVPLFSWVFNVNYFTFFMVSGTILVMIGVLFSTRLTKIFGKREAYMGCMAVIAITMALQYLVKPNDVKLLFALHWLYSLASGPTMPLVWSMYADTADYSEWKTGRRATGLVYSASTFAYKFGGAIGGVILMAILGIFGYVANKEQTARSLVGIRLCLSIIPGVLAALTVVLLYFYRLDTKQMDTIQSDLDKRRQLEGASAKMDASAGTPMGESDEV